MTTIPFDDPRWKASPAPNTPLSITKDKLVLKANKGTDWWRNQERNSTDGVVYGFEVDVSKGIEVSVELDIHHKDRYDQATLFLQLGPTTWVKAGLEFDGQLLSGAVVTFPYSDWAIRAHPGGPQRYTIRYKDRKLLVFEDDLMVREVNVFGEHTDVKALVGVMGCSPLGEGAEGVYRGFTLKTGM
ncbi:hypothetical protein DB88DRAFT_475456 [Papiliotrema laurentii]|uniref:Uncharacterized protein n=1 Tax=Papiliotrema laurentii TaxID=5418 RepID=A0AAD9CUZ4_PAPLA|nr:hypothetical protein DB88DRAFT_475456 [Papiliotrema laurentii]